MAGKGDVHKKVNNMAKLLGFTQPAICYAVGRGELLAKKGKYDLLD